MTDALRTTTLETLIKRCAFDLGDIHLLEATGGSTSTIIDAINLPTGNMDVTRRQIVFTSGANRGVYRVITDFDASTHTATFAPVVGTAVAAAVTAYLINRQGIGFTYLEYKDAVNQVSEDAYPIFRVPVAGSTSVFDADTGLLTIPDTIDEVYAVQWQDENGDWWPLEYASRMSYRGWQVNRYDNQVIVNDLDLRSSIDGYTVRVLGEGRPAPMVDYDDTTLLHPDYVVAAACAKLALMGMERDITGTRARQVGVFEEKAQRNKHLIRTLREPGSVITRSS